MSEEKDRQTPDTATNPVVAQIEQIANQNNHAAEPAKSAEPAKAKVAKRPHGKLVLSGTAIALIVENAILVILIILTLVGFIGVTLKMPGQKMALNQRVCGDDIVNKWNKIYAPDAKEAQNTATDKLADQVKQKAGYQNDATCLYIVFQSAVGSSDVKVADSALKSMKELNAAGVSTDDRMLYRQSISDMESALKSLNDWLNNSK